MILLFITRSLSGGGAEKVTSTLANYCAELGHCVHVVTYSVSQTDYCLSGEVVLHDHSEIRETKRPGKLKQLHSSFEFDAIISLGSKYNYIALSGLLKTGRVILSERNDPKKFYSNALHFAFVAWCYRCAAGVVFQTRHARNCFKSIDCVEIIPNPVAKPRYMWSEENHEKVVVNFCRLEPQKNLKLLIDAFDLFSLDQPDYQLHIYGEGSLKESLQQNIEKNKSKDRVFIRPFAENIHEIISKAEIFASSSDYEGMSNSLLESMSMGIPVVSTDCGGGSARELLAGVPGPCLVERGDVAAMAQALNTVSRDTDLRIEMSRSELSLSKNFEPLKVTQKWVEFIECCVCR